MWSVQRLSRFLALGGGTHPCRGPRHRGPRLARYVGGQEIRGRRGRGKKFHSMQVEPASEAQGHWRRPRRWRQDAVRPADRDQTDAAATTPAARRRTRCQRSRSWQRSGGNLAARRGLLTVTVTRRMRRRQPQPTAAAAETALQLEAPPPAAAWRWRRRPLAESESFRVSFL